MLRQPIAAPALAGPSAEPSAEAGPSALPTPAKPAYRSERIQSVNRAMGTRIVLASYTDEQTSEEQIRKALAKAFAEIVRIEDLMTTWRDDSEVSRINANAGKQAIKVSEDTFRVIERSLWISELSEGTFDITFASMGKLWRFDEDRRAVVPDAALIAKARKRIDYRNIELDDKARSVKLTKPNRRISLGGIAKGYAIDRAAQILSEAGLRSFFAQAGGDLYVKGRKPWGEPWKVGVRDPRGANEEAFFAVLPVEDHAFSTAGDYERAFIKDGKRYHHIIDPRTGYPATASRSVTIWAKDALTADAIDDAVFILGPEKGLALVESIDDCGAVIVDAKNRVHISKRLRGLVAVLRSPSDGI